MSFAKELHNRFNWQLKAFEVSDSLQNFFFFALWIRLALTYQTLVDKRHSKSGGLIERGTPSSRTVRFAVAHSAIFLESSESNFAVDCE